ncbi:hypothetical protein RclHR1_00800023 [Rhizophagus clarus]|uniref:Kinase-like domain-containing protein n=1 Tax=Rhizophagus clarus TaxID=94130 RepID=A0A2Z6RZE4_9GLOM|nr:hypothetical protein RclHR1_00800023 [Rhizophagus clarus]GES80036.1 kinase-like domain-containing protein [Rhizophagus clarus]
MSTIREELVRVALNKPITFIDYKNYNDIPKQIESRRQTILDDKLLTNDEKNEAIRRINKSFDRDKILYNIGTKRICENCKQECFVTSYCEFCVRNYLKEKFSNWSSGNNDIDNLIQKCQMDTIDPERVIEWIPYDQLQNINYYVAKCDCSSADIYTAVWIDGCYNEWDSKEKQLKRFGRQKVVLKSLDNVENENRNWFEEVKSCLTISEKWPINVHYYGLTQDPSSGNYMLVTNAMDVNLREFLQQNQLTWREKIQIAVDVANALYIIHEENAIQRDLHSGNLLYSPRSNKWYINELGLCGPVDKLPKNIYGNLPYIAPEVIVGKHATKASNIYSIAMVMWEISSMQPPFVNREHDYHLATDIVSGMRPNIIPGTPSEYENLMKQCWDADPLKRLDAHTLWEKLNEIKLFYLNELYESIKSEVDGDLNKKSTNYTNDNLSTSKIYQFENMPEPRNATEDEQEAFYNKSYDIHVSDNVNGIDKINIQNEGIRNETIQQIKSDIDENGVCNNPNLHSEEQDELEIPDNI